MALLSPGSDAFESLTRWLVARQTSELGDEEDALEEDDNNDNAHIPLSTVKADCVLPNLPTPSTESVAWAGFNGRCNKYADTCYSFWNGATLTVRIPR